MKKILAILMLFVLLSFILLTFSGCTFKIETTDNSVSASVDEDTTQQVDNIIDWIKQRLKRVFKTDSESDSNPIIEENRSGERI